MAYNFVTKLFGFENSAVKFASLSLLNFMGAINVIVYFILRKSTRKDFDSERSPFIVKSGEISLEATLLHSNKSDIPTL